MLTPEEAEALLDIADEAILSALEGRRLRQPDPSALPSALREPASAFVTVLVDGALNGCIGAVDDQGHGSGEPLHALVARLARSAAFEDPRLPPLRADEFERTTIEISLLSPIEPLDVTDRDGLFLLLRPNVDGLVLTVGQHRGLFLPSVWAQLPDADDFLDHLQRKAGLAPEAWPEGLRIARFTTTVFERVHRPPARR